MPSTRSRSNSHGSQRRTGQITSSKPGTARQAARPRHRPGIARVEGDRIILDGTTVEEVAEGHRKTLKVVVAKVNQDVEEWERRRRRAAEDEAERQRQHRQAVEDAAKRISFD